MQNFKKLCMKLWGHKNELIKRKEMTDRKILKDKKFGRENNFINDKLVYESYEVQQPINCFRFTGF